MDEQTICHGCKHPASVHYVQYNGQRGCREPGYPACICLGLITYYPLAPTMPLQATESHGEPPIAASGGLILPLSGGRSESAYKPYEWGRAKITPIPVETPLTRTGIGVIFAPVEPEPVEPEPVEPEPVEPEPVEPEPVEPEPPALTDEELRFHSTAAAMLKYSTRSPGSGSISPAEMRADEAARELGISDTRVYRMARDGELPAESYGMHGRWWKFKRADIKRIKAEMEQIRKLLAEAEAVLAARIARRGGSND